MVFVREHRGGGTYMNLSHHGLTSPEDVANNGAAWKACLDRLEELLSR